MRLYARMAEYFPNSPLAAEALYRAGDIRWQIEYADIKTLPSAKEQDPDVRPKMEEEIMRQVMKKYPHTKWADLAAYHLLDNKVCGDWQAQSKCPERETELYEKYAIPAPGRPLFQAATATLNPNSATRVNVENSTRGPLLLVSGAADHTVPPVLVKSTLNVYRKSGAITELKSFENRGHSLTIDSGWREIAEYSANWLRTKGLGAN